MTINYNPVPLDYTDEELRTVVEEYIADQKSEFSFKKMCLSILHRAMDEGKTVDSRHTQYESNELKASDGNRISRILWDMISLQLDINRIGELTVFSLIVHYKERFLAKA